MMPMTQHRREPKASDQLSPWMKLQIIELANEQLGPKLKDKVSQDFGVRVQDVEIPWERTEVILGLAHQATICFVAIVVVLGVALTLYFTTKLVLASLEKMKLK